MIPVWLVIGLALLLIAVVARLGSRVRERRGGPLELEPMVVRPEKQLRIATLNIQYGRGEDQRLNLQRTASAIKHSDFVALQEVLGARGFNQPDQAASLGGMLDMAWLYAPTKTRWFKAYSGNAILTRVPVTQWVSRPLVHVRGRAFRNMVVCEVVLAGKKVAVINTHLHTKEGREDQMKQVFREFAKYRRAILLGDFNTSPQDALLQELVLKGGAHDPIGVDPNQAQSNARVDWIILKGLIATEVVIGEPGPSDHPVLRATVELQ